VGKSRTKPAPEKKSAPPPLRLEYRKPSELAANPANWRRHPEAQLQALADVIADVGWAGVLLYNERTKRLIDGHARKEIAEESDEPVPVVIGSWTQAQERTILATLDPLAAMAEADNAALESLLEGVSSSSAAVNAMLDELRATSAVANVEAGGGGDEFDATPEDKGPTRTNPGELWVIGGKHRLFVGDCTVPENVARLMGGATVGLCFTSPPYAQQRDYGEAAKEKVQDWYALMCGAFAHLPMQDAGQVLVNLGLVHREGEWVPYWDGWISWMREQGWRRFGWYVWDQGFGLPGDWQGRFAPAFEFVFHFNREATRPEKTQPKREDSIEVKHGKGMRRKDGVVQAQLSNPEACLATHKIPDSVIRVNRNATMDAAVRASHPATFPLAFPEFVLSAWDGDVYEPFLGSGTTMLASHRLNRRCFGCEIDPRYADVVLKRMEAEGLDCVRVKEPSR
jgi:DNA modification methylase